MLNTGTQVKPEVKITGLLADAADSAKRGSVVCADHYVGEARRYAQEAGITLTEDQEAEIAGTTKSARVNAVGVNLAEAANSAKRGSVDGADRYVGNARRYAQEAGITLTEDQEAEIVAIDKWLGRK